ncbi:MAG: hypothetical protein ABW185_12135 [Sedimenticola sp.]
MSRYIFVIHLGWNRSGGIGIRYASCCTRGGCINHFHGLREGHASIILYTYDLSFLLPKWTITRVGSVVAFAIDAEEITRARCVVVICFTSSSTGDIRLAIPTMAEALTVIASQWRWNVSVHSKMKVVSSDNRRSTSWAREYQYVRVDQDGLPVPADSNPPDLDDTLSTPGASLPRCCRSDDALTKVQGLVGLHLDGNVHESLGTK